MSNRNKDVEYAGIERINRPRSAWHREWSHKTTFNNGDLIPYYIDMDLVPGTTIKQKTTAIVRLTTPITPTMDTAYVDTYCFKCQKQWYWENWRAMMGENRYGAWANSNQFQFVEPKIEIVSGYTFGIGDLGSYFGIRQGTAGLKFSKIAVNSYLDCWNQWFRDENLQAPIQFDTTDADLQTDGTINTGCGILKAGKLHDYFSSAYLTPEKATNPITIPLGTTAPVIGNGTLGLTDGTNNNGLYYNTSYGLDMRTSGYGTAVGTATSAGTGAVNGETFGVSTDPTKSGLIADLTAATAATINALRLAFASQRILESWNRAGTRYSELLNYNFGSQPADQNLQRPEYIGGKRQPISISSIFQTSSTDNTSPLGWTGAVSVTGLENEDFTENFDVDCILLCLAVVRCEHSYAQRLPRQFTRDGTFDRFWPQFSKIGSQPIYNYEIFATGTNTDQQVFAYKEAWQEYIYKENMVTGAFSPDYATSLDYWTYVDDYATTPVFSAQWIEEPVTFLDRTIAVQSSNQPQFLADFFIEQDVHSIIPLNRQPGLLDHM